MTSIIESTTPQVAINDIGDAEAFAAAVDETIKYFNDGDLVGPDRFVTVYGPIPGSIITGVNDEPEPFLAARELLQRCALWPVAGDHRMHAGHGECCAFVDAADFRVRIGAAHEGGVQHAGELDVVDEAALAALDQELQLALIPKDPDDERNAFLEIRAGTGGDEAAPGVAGRVSCTG